jgi:hypothetical protein
VYVAVFDSLTAAKPVKLGEMLGVQHGREHALYLFCSPGEVELNNLYVVPRPHTVCPLCANHLSFTENKPFGSKEPGRTHQ